VKVDVVVDVATALSVSVAAGLASSAELSTQVSAAKSNAGRIGREKYSLRLLKAAPIPVNHRTIFSTMPPWFERRRQHRTRIFPQSRDVTFPGAATGMALSEDQIKPRRA
jgi:hypothetical protein